jgi:hypothetical protein
VPTGVEPSLIDHRYFYKVEGEGAYACGVAREAVASQLHLYGMNKVGFMGSLRSLDQFINNKSVVGFFIEQAVLQTIQSRGLKVDEKISNSMDIITFDGFPVFNTLKERALYVPSGFNCRAIDGIILWLDLSNRKKGQKKEALLFPLQVTIAKSHSNSEEIFFSQWEEWTRSLEDFDVKATFLWITDKDPSVADIGEDQRSMKHGNVLKNPAYSSRRISLSYVNMDIWNRYEKALHDKKRRDLKSDKQVPGKSKEQEKVEETMRSDGASNEQVDLPRKKKNKRVKRGKGA